ncbi:MAG: DUF3332 family protein [Cytophagales bacterium]
MKKFIRPIAFTLVALFSAQLLTSCFGKFALVNKLYDFNNGLGGKDLAGRFIKTLVFWVMTIIPIYGIAAFIDIIILNLIEFWTGSNILSMKEGESETQFLTYAGREFQLTGTKGKMSIKELSGKNAGKETVLYFNNDNTIVILNEGKMVKVADYNVSNATFASFETGIVVAGN